MNEKAMAEKIDISYKIQRYSPIISIASAIIVAALTGFVSFRVARVETETHKIVASLEAETKKNIVFSEHHIRKTELFQELIGQLRDEKTGPLALLVLWQMYNEFEQRKTTIVAAFEVKKPEIISTLIRLEKKEDWEPYLDIVQRLANSDDPKISDLARNFWGIVDDNYWGQYFLDDIIGDEDVNAMSDSVLKLIELAKRSTSVKKLILTKCEAVNDHLPILYYVLYRAGKKMHFQTLLNKNSLDPDTFEKYIGIIDVGGFDDKEIKQIASFAAKYLRLKLGEDFISDIIAFSVIADSYRYKIKLNNEESESIVNLSKLVILDRSESSRVRFFALLALKNINAKQALLVIAEVMARGDVDLSLKHKMSKFMNPFGIDTELIGTSLVEQFDNYKIPNIEDKSTVWNEFFQDLKNEIKS